MSYNSKEYIKLLMYDQFLKNRGTTLRKQNKLQYLTMVKHGVRISDEVHWQSRFEYLDIMQKLVDLKIDSKTFMNNFYRIFKKNENIVKSLKTDVQRLENFQLNSKSLGFSKWISDLEIGGDEFYFDPEEQSLIEYEIKFRAFVFEFISQIQSFCEK